MAILLSVPCHGEDGDMLRFQNGDQLHGDFSGITKGASVLWQRKDVGSGVEFSSSELRQIVLSGGRPEKSLQRLSHIGTVNGDRIPGIVRELDRETNPAEKPSSPGYWKFPANRWVS